MDWNNIDLNSPSESAANILDSYSFDTLLLEISCNLREITPATVRNQARESIKAKYQEALSILESNLINITNKAIEYRSME
jgi:hypothetical protein